MLPASSIWRRLRLVRGAGIAALLLSCQSGTEPHGEMRPQTVVLFATPKFVADFDNPGPSIAAFFDQYAPLTTKAANTVVIFSVGNSDHILYYKGKHDWGQWLEWARTTNNEIAYSRILTYNHVAAIVAEIRREATARGLQVSVYDQIDSGNEFTATNDFKYGRHLECIANEWHSFDVAAPMKADAFVYATAPNGIPEGKKCGDFLVDQSVVYLRDLGFDGILYDNQLGTRGRWLPEMAPGRSDAETAAISAFFEYTDEKFAELELMWFDSYNKLEIERDRWSMPEDAYDRFDYLIASGFCVVTTTQRYYENLRSKLSLRPRTKVLATLDYLDPWYSYKSMIEYKEESEMLEVIALQHKYDVDGIIFFAHGSEGQLIPKSIIDSFAARYFKD